MRMDAFYCANYKRSTLLATYFWFRMTLLCFDNAESDRKSFPNRRAFVEMAAA